MEPYKNKACALLAGVFLAGLVTGALAVRVYYSQAAKADSAHHLPTNPAEAAKHLRDDLTLSESQTAQVEDILDDCIMREADMLMQTKQIRLEARQRISALLNDEQRIKFDKVIDEVSTQ